MALDSIRENLSSAKSIAVPYGSIPNGTSVAQESQKPCSPWAERRNSPPADLYRAKIDSSASKKGSQKNSSSGIPD